MKILSEKAGKHFLRFSTYAYLCAFSGIIVVLGYSVQSSPIKMALTFFLASIGPYVVTTEVAYRLLGRKIYQTPRFSRALCWSFLTAFLVAFTVPALSYALMRLYAILVGPIAVNYGNENFWLAVPVYGGTGIIYSLPEIIIFGYLLARSAQRHSASF